MAFCCWHSVILCISYIQPDPSKQRSENCHILLTHLHVCIHHRLVLYLPTTEQHVSYISESLIQISSCKPIILKYLCSVPQDKCRDRNSNQATITSFQVFSNSLPITHPTLRRHIFWATESAQGRGSSGGVVTRYGPEGPGSNPGGGEIFRTRPDRPWGNPASSKMGTGSLSQG
jgi:hypothetical protein